MRSPARVASLSRDSGARSDIKAGVSMISVSANAAGAANAMDRPRQAEPSVSHMNLLAIQIAFTLVRSESCRRGPEPAPKLSVHFVCAGKPARKIGRASCRERVAALELVTSGNVKTLQRKPYEPADLSMV